MLFTMMEVKYAPVLILPKGASRLWTPKSLVRNGDGNRP